MQIMHRLEIKPGCHLSGAWIHGQGEPLVVTAPWSGDVLETISSASIDDVSLAVTVAENAWLTWRNTPPSHRVDFLMSFAALLDGHAQELAELQVRENGKLLKEMQGQAAQFGDHLRYYASLLRMPSGYVVDPPIGLIRVHTERAPLGVVACLTPWNSPLSLLLWKLGPAIAAGNTVVIKPSELTPLSTLRLVELAYQAGLPSGVLNVVTGDRAIGQALVGHPKVAKIAFTGSSQAGEAVAMAAARGLRRVSLELGGKSANIVFADADIAQAVRGVIGGVFGASGQTCMAGSRILVESSIYAEVLQQLVSAANAIRIGNPFDPLSDMGSVASKAQLHKIEAMVNQAIADGACVMAGGRREQVVNLQQGLFYRPTVLTNIAEDACIVHEEVFGPVACVLPFRDEQDAVRLANATHYGLAAGVWTKDRACSDRMASHLQAGTVWINNYRKVAFNVPFGGMGMSGIGRENGPDCLAAYSECKAIWVDQGLGVRDPFDPRAS